MKMSFSRYVDETPIEKQHDLLIGADAILGAHLEFINCAFKFLDHLVRLNPHESKEHLHQLLIVVRSFNSAAAGLKLAMSGYWQQSFALMRDVMECEFLLDLFHGSPQRLADWVALNERERKKKFSPIEVRKSLDTRDGNIEQKREKAYSLLSLYASHPTPEGFQLLQSNGKSQVGPFPDQEKLRAALAELAKQLARTCHFSRSLFDNSNAACANLLINLEEQKERWLDVCVP